MGFPVWGNPWDSLFREDLEFVIWGNLWDFLLGQIYGIPCLGKSVESFIWEKSVGFPVWGNLWDSLFGEICGILYLGETLGFLPEGHRNAKGIFSKSVIFCVFLFLMCLVFLQEFLYGHGNSVIPWKWKSLGRNCLDSGPVCSKNSFLFAVISIFHGNGRVLGLESVGFWCCFLQEFLFGCRNLIFQWKFWAGIDWILKLLPPRTPWIQ